MSIDALLSRVDARPNGRDRWRCACPVCGEGNRSTLSIGIGDTGAVLLKCFKSGCTPEQIADATGLELSDLFPERTSHSQPLKRRRLLTAGQALALLDAEMTLAVVVASDVAKGKPIDDDTRDRLMLSAARVSMLRDEVCA